MLAADGEPCAAEGVGVLELVGVAGVAEGGAGEVGACFGGGEDAAVGIEDDGAVVGEVWR